MDRWSEIEIEHLKRLANAGGLFYTEIAKKLGRPAATVRWKAKQLGLKGNLVPERFGKWNSKHSHLRKEAMTYFLTHTWEETREHFELTQSELKSLFAVGYRQADLKHLRKEKRDHSPWTAEQLKFLLQHAGLRPRKWILERVNRGSNVCLVKERLQTLGLSSRTMQGLTLSQYQQAFGERPKFYLQTDAGPDGGKQGSLPTRWKIVPWVWLDQEIKAKRIKTAPEMRMLISARAKFQEWIFEGNALRKMKRIVRNRIEKGDASEHVSES